MKNLRTISMLLACFSGILLLTSCTEAPRPHYYVPEGPRAYFNYQVGSYWVMKDSATGEMDSFYVDSYDVSNLTEIENIRTHITRNPTNGSVWLHLTYVHANLAFSQGSTDLAYDFAINYPFILGKHGMIFPSDGEYKMFLYPKLLINGKFEDSVYLACCNNIDPNNRFNDTIYFNRNKGFLQLKLNNANETHNWILQSQKIIR